MVLLLPMLLALQTSPPAGGVDPLGVAAAAHDEDFPGVAEVSVDALVAELERVAAALERDPAVVAEFVAFAAQHGLPETTFRDYVRVKLVFEATRDGGFWRLQWRITNRSPNSEAIWEQWRKLTVIDADATGKPTAVAECDELSALFAFLVRKLGVDGVGLFWPVWNHVVAVWTTPDRSGKPLRIVVPTSQIFLSPVDTLGTNGFDPYRQKTIYTYKRRDVAGHYGIPAALARFFLAQARRYGGSTLAEAQTARNRRALAAAAGAR